MNFKKDVAVFILTHGRPDKVITYTKLRECGYTGKIYLIVDDLDKTKDQYIEKYGDEVIIFSKEATAGTFDMGDNFGGMGVVIYACNASFQIAKDLGLTHFMMLDDDCIRFAYRFTHEKKYANEKKILSFDEIFKALLKFQINTQVTSIALSQNGEWFGGKDGTFGSKLFLKRKGMNSFLFATNKPVEFIGRLNEDVNIYTRHGNLGHIFFTTNWLSIGSRQTQASSGGLTEIYKAVGTYVKSFYSIMYQPSSVGMMMMGATEKRIHHKVIIKHTVPKIISEVYKKAM